MRDGLTGLYNRRALDETIEQVVRNAKDGNGSNCIMIIDGDHFKNVNDTYGHQAGDAVLVALAGCLSTLFGRSEDFVARYGGEEFAVISHAGSREAAYQLGQNVIKAVRSLEITYDGVHIPVTVSVGLTTLRSGEDGASWVARADQSLYKAKESGRDRCIMSS